MSLDISLISNKKTEVTCDCCGQKRKEYEVLFEANITHNLGKMAGEAGLYTILWHPEKSGLKKAKDFIKQVEKSLTDMKERPDHYKQFDSPNGWGVYDDFIRWIEMYLEALKKYPDSKIEASG